MTSPLPPTRWLPRLSLNLMSHHGNLVKVKPLPPTVPEFVKDHPDGVTLSLRIQPRAKRAGVVGIAGSSLKIAVASPPVDGKANEALCRYLAKALKVSKSSVVILRGETNREKIILIRDVDARSVVAALHPS